MVDDQNDFFEIDTNAWLDPEVNFLEMHCMDDCFFESVSTDRVYARTVSVLDCDPNGQIKCVAEMSHFLDAQRPERSFTEILSLGGCMAFL